MKKIAIIGAVVLVMLSMATLLTASLFSGLSGKVVANSAQPVLLTTQNIDEYLQETPIVQDLPKDASLQIEVENNNYVVSKGNVIESDGAVQYSDIDIIIQGDYLDKEYFSICELAREALKNGDVSIETSLSKAELLWKYKGMIKYKECVTG